MTTYQIACNIATTDSSAKLGLEIWLDNRSLWSSDHITEPTTLTFDIEEDEADHELQFVMKNKSSDHTKIDENNNIISDARLIISQLAFDEIALGQILIDLSTYTHNFNGTQDTIIDKFYGEMGCNGTVSLKFSTPIYLWLLENM